MAARKKHPADHGHRSRTALVILGMHRSGTSAMTGVLGQMGCDLPQDLMGPAEINVAGFFESNRITGLNEELLASAGFRWFSFPGFPADWFASPKADEFLERAVEVIGAEYGRSHLFALKDPRICRLLPFWQRALGVAGCRPVYVCIHRHPQEVVGSLTRWANYDLDYGLLLWLRHVLDAEAESRGQPRVFTSYDRLMADWAGTVRAIGKGLDLTWPRSPEIAASGVEDFLRAELQHFSHSKTDGRSTNAMPDWVVETYGILESWAAKGERAADHKRLDRIRAGLDYASSTFAGVTWRIQQQRLQLQDQQRHIEDLEGPVQQAHMDALQKSQAEAHARIAELSVSRAEIAATAATHEINHRTEQLNRAAAEAQAAELEKLLDQARGDAANYRTEQLARQSAESRLAELSAALQRAEADALSHESDHGIEQQSRAAAEAKAGELQVLLDAVRVDADNSQHDLQAQQKSNARLEEVSEALTLAHAEAEGRIAGLAEKLALAQANNAAALAEAERLCNEARGAAADLLVQLAQGEAALQTLQDARAALEEDLRHTQELRLTAEHEASHLRSALIQRGQEADDLHDQTARDERRLADLEAALETTRRDHAALSDQDERNSRHLEILTRRVTEYVRQDLEDRLKPPLGLEDIEREHQALIADYEIRLISNRKTRAAAETDLARVKAEKAALAAEADALRGKVSDRGHEIHALKKRLETGQSVHVTLASQLASVEAQVEEAAKALKAEVQQLKALEAEMEGLMASLSWRVTRPVRAMSGILRRVVPARK